LGIGLGGVFAATGAGRHGDHRYDDAARTHQRQSCLPLLRGTDTRRLSWIEWSDLDGRRRLGNRVRGGSGPAAPSPNAAGANTAQPARTAAKNLILRSMDAPLSAYSSL